MTDVLVLGLAADVLTALAKVAGPELGKVLRYDAASYRRACEAAQQEDRGPHGPLVSTRP